MIVIHIDTMADTARLKRVYEGLDNVTLLYNKSREEVEEVLRTNNDKLVMCLGHGSSFGLFGAGWHGYVIDKHNAYLLQDRTVIGIWCYASSFADAVGLHGYFTSMFISNAGEALCHGFYDYDDDDIFGEIDFFCDQIRGFIENQTAMNCWVPILQEVCHKEKNYVRFNYEAMAYFDEGDVKQLKIDFDKTDSLSGSVTDCQTEYDDLSDLLETWNGGYDEESLKDVM